MKNLIPFFVALLLFNYESGFEKNTTTNTFAFFTPLTAQQNQTEISPKNTIDFIVDTVKIADSLLPTVTAQQVFENKLGKKILYFPSQHKNKQFVNARNNGLIQTVQNCYDTHRPLTLSPDIIWLAICQGAAIHINENYDSLKNVIFKNEKPVTLTVRNDNLEDSPKEWEKLIADLSADTKTYTNKDLYSFFVPNFSTTTTINTTTYQITLMAAFEKKFKYVGESGCGIPSIKLLGNKKDWQNIYEKLDKLDAIGLADWKENLKPIIQQFIASYDGNIDPLFWQDIYKNASEYNGFYISGWIIKFFPYIKTLENWKYDKEKHSTRVDEVYKPNPFLNGFDYLRSDLSTDNFPSGIAKIKLKWNNYTNNEYKDLEIYAGYFGIEQEKDKSLAPLISWVICEKNSPKIESKFEWFHLEPEAHNNNTYWSPNIPDILSDSAIYDIKNYTNQSSSLAPIKTILRQAIAKNPKTKNINPTGIKIEFVVLTNGSITEIKIMNRTNKNVETIIKNELNNLPKKWFPALNNIKNNRYLMFVSEKDKDLKIKVNSLVKLTLN